MGFIEQLDGVKKINGSADEGIFVGYLPDGKKVAFKKSVADDEGRENGLPGVPLKTMREAALLKRLKHNNIISLQNVEHDANSIYLVLEWMDCDLRSDIDERRYLYGGSSPHVKGVLRQVLHGLAHCHTRRVLHRELKPQNLLIDREKDVVKIANFGWARNIGVPAGRLTPMAGTFSYMAPEILVESSYSAPADIWSVGCLFAEMVTGTILFPGDSPITVLGEICRVFGKLSEDLYPQARSSGVEEFKNHHEHEMNPLSGLREKVGDFDSDGFDLLCSMLQLDPSKRITAGASLNHAYLTI